MKRIQITMDEALLDALDRDPAVAERGRSAVVRDAIAAHLAKGRDLSIAEAYSRGYGAHPTAGLAGWTNGRTWPGRGSRRSLER